MQPAVQPQDHSQGRKRVVALIRVSSARQAQEDRSGIARQQRVIEQTIKAKNLDCLRMYSISDVSGTDVRTNVDVIEILQLVASKVVTGLVVADLDRLFRPDQPTDYAILQTFKDTGATIFCSDSEYDLGNKNGLLFSNIRSAFSGFELSLMKERQQGGREAKRRASKCPTNHLTRPMGADFDRATEKWMWNERARDVVEIFALFEQTQNYSEIGRRFGVTGQTVRNILRNPIYLGRRVINQKRGAKRVSRTGKTYRVKVDRAPDEVIEANVLEPLITQAQFDRVAGLMKAVRFNHVEARRRDEAFNVGAGIAYCQHCGEKLYCSSGKRTGGTRCGQYLCKRNYYLYRDKLGGCRQQNLRQPDVDRLIMEFATRTLIDEGTLTALISDSMRRTQEVVHPFPLAETGDAQVRALKRKEARLLDAYQDGAIDLETMRPRLDAIRREVTALQRRLAEPPVPLETGVGDLARKIVRGAFRLKRVTDAKTRKEIVHALFSEIYVKDDAITGFTFRENLHKDATGRATANAAIQLPTPFRLPATEPGVPDGHRRCSCCRGVFAASEFFPRKGECKPCIAIKARAAHQRRKLAKAAAAARP